MSHMDESHDSSIGTSQNDNVSSNKKSKKKGGA